MTRVKVCGLTRVEDVLAVASAGADAVGAVVDVPVDTPREVSPERASDLFAAAPPFVTTVLVTMPESVGRARDLLETVEPDAVQVHGTLSPREVSRLRETVPAGVLVALDLADDVDGYAEAADAILLDSTDERGAGGTGRTHDWDATRRVRQRVETPVVVAGGLTPENVREAVETIDPYAVDVASGVEASGGVKDETAVEAFVDRARTAGVDA